jgi:hypothetical protein
MQTHPGWHAHPSPNRRRSWLWERPLYRPTSPRSHSQDVSRHRSRPLRGYHHGTRQNVRVQPSLLRQYVFRRRSSRAKALTLFTAVVDADLTVLIPATDQARIFGLAAPGNAVFGVVERGTTRSIVPRPVLLELPHTRFAASGNRASEGPTTSCDHVLKLAAGDPVTAHAPVIGVSLRLVNPHTDADRGHGRGNDVRFGPSIVARYGPRAS